MIDLMKLYFEYLYERNILIDLLFNIIFTVIPSNPSLQGPIVH